LIIASIFREASAHIDKDSAKKVGDGESRPMLGCRISNRNSLYLVSDTSWTERYIKYKPAFAIQNGDLSGGAVRSKSIDQRRRQGERH